MACVDADPNASFIFDLSDDVAKVFEGAANDIAATSHVFEHGLDGLGCCMGAVKGSGYASNGFGARGGAGVARVEVVEFDA